MKTILCKVLAVLIACGGIIVSIIEKEPFVFFGFILGGFIAYELAILMENKNK